MVSQLLIYQRVRRCANLFWSDLDCNIYVRSARAGARVMASISRFITQRLKLKVNEKKSAVDRPQNRSFLGFSFTGGKSPNRRKVAPKALARCKARVKELTRRSQGRSLGKVITTLSVYLRGWRGYFGFCQTPAVLRDLDSWIRHRLRCLQWKHWRLLLDSRGVDVPMAYNPTLVMPPSLKPLFFNSLKRELRFSDNVGA